MYAITLNDGTVIGNLKLINNTLRTTEKLTREMFAGKLSPVTITGESTQEESSDFAGLAGTHEAMQVCYIKQIDGMYALALADIPEKDWERMKIRADVDYAIMLGGGKF